MHNQSRFCQTGGVYELNTNQIFKTNKQKIINHFSQTIQEMLITNNFTQLLFLNEFHYSYVLNIVESLAEESKARQYILVNIDLIRKNSSIPSSITLNKPLHDSP